MDMVAVDAENRTILAASCKWTTEPMDVSDYAALQRDIAFAEAELRPVKELTLVLFSHSGFTPRLQQMASAEGENLLLVDIEQMYEHVQ